MVKIFLFLISMLLCSCNICRHESTKSVDVGDDKKIETINILTIEF